MSAVGARAMLAPSSRRAAVRATIPVSASTSRHQLQGIEAARGIAAALVVVYHAARHLDGNGLGLPWMGGIERFGHAGVDFFFVLSGFIILFAHWDDLGRPSALPRYAERRATRIYPLYWPVLAVYLAMASLGAREIDASATSLLANVLLLPTAQEPILGVAWTLQHEMLFYAAFAVLLVSRSLGPVLLTGWLGVVLAVAAGWIEPLAGGWGRVALSAYNLQFALGMLAAWVARRAHVRPTGAIAWLGGLAFFAVGVAESEGLVDGYEDPARMAYGAAAWLLVIGLVERERVSGLRVPRLLALLGKASYSIYLVHLLFMGVAYKLLDGVGATQLPAHFQLLLLVSIGIAGGVLVSRWIETPLTALARRLWARAVRREGTVAT